MVALCIEHHAKADAGAFTVDQLREFKRTGTAQHDIVVGRFDWLRNDMLAIVGNLFCYETPNIVVFRGEPVIWFARDENGLLLLNLRMLTTANEPRVVLEDNFWISRGSPTDLVCPPSGRLLEVRYDNDDCLRVEFLVLENADALLNRHDDISPHNWGLDFPITAVEIFFRVGGTGIEFRPRQTSLGGRTIEGGMFVSRCGNGLSF